MNNSLEYQHDLSNFDGDIQQIQQYYQNLNAQNKQNSITQKGIMAAKETGETLKSAHEYLGAMETALGSAYAPKIVSDIVKPSYYALKSKLGFGGDPAEEATATTTTAAGDGAAVAPAAAPAAGIGADAAPLTTNTLVSGTAGTTPAYSALDDVNDFARLWGPDGAPALSGSGPLPSVPGSADAPPAGLPDAPEIPMSPMPDDAAPVNPSDIRPWENAEEGDEYDLDDALADLGDDAGQVGQAGGGLPAGVSAFDGMEGGAVAPGIAGDVPIIGTTTAQTAATTGAGVGADVGTAAGTGAGVGADVGTAAGIGAVEGAVDSTAAANWWNPLGWVLGAAGLAVGGYEAVEALRDSHKAAQQQQAISRMGSPARVNPGDISGSYIQPVLNQENPN